MSLQNRVARLEAATGRTGTCPRCGRTADADVLESNDPHGPAAEAEFRRLSALPPEQLRAEHEAVLGPSPTEDRPLPPDDEIYQPECSRCGNPTRPALTFGALRRLPPEELVRLHYETL